MNGTIAPFHSRKRKSGTLWTKITSLRSSILTNISCSFKLVIPKLRPAGRIRPTKTFYPARGALLKNICTHFEPELDIIMSGIPSFGFLSFYVFREHTKILGEK